MKIKLAICLTDDIYQERFVRCLMKHYKERYEFHMYHFMSELLEDGFGQYDGFILDEGAMTGCDIEEWVLQKTLLLKEEDKYQEVYKIMEAMELLLSNQGMNFATEKNTKPVVVGIYSMDFPAFQLPFSVMLSEILSENKKTIFLDLQEYSGFIREGELGLEDMLMMATTENFTRGRVLSAIGHYSNWDYVYPLKNIACLMEVTGLVLRSLIECLSSEFGYEVIILNFGDILANAEEVFMLCDKTYLLCSKENGCLWREKQFTETLARKGKQNVLHRIQRMEVSTVSGADQDWSKLADQWRWGKLGDYLRKLIREGDALGELV